VSGGGLNKTNKIGGLEVVQDNKRASFSTYPSGSESSVNRLLPSPSCAELSAFNDGAAEVPSRDPLDRLSCRSCSKTTGGTAGSSLCFCVFFLFSFRLRRASSSFENPLGPALGSATSPPWVFGLSIAESWDDRPLLSIALDSADIVQERRDLFSPFKLEDEESAIIGM
jgi:hypothetical protein